MKIRALIRFVTLLLLLLWVPICGMASGNNVYPIQQGFVDAEA